MKNSLASYSGIVTVLIKAPCVRQLVMNSQTIQNSSRGYCSFQQFPCLFKFSWSLFSMWSLSDAVKTTMLNLRPLWIAHSRHGPSLNGSHFKISSSPNGPFTKSGLGAGNIYFTSHAGDAKITHHILQTLGLCIAISRDAPKRTFFPKTSARSPDPFENRLESRAQQEHPPEPFLYVSMTKSGWCFHSNASLMLKANNASISSAHIKLTMLMSSFHLHLPHPLPTFFIISLV